MCACFFNQEIYKRGGRKFGFLNLVRIGCFPSMRDRKPGREGACTDKFTPMVKLHNRELAKVLVKLERQLKGFKYSKFDLYTSLEQRVNDPSKYGIRFLSYFLSLSHHNVLKHTQLFV